MTERKFTPFKKGDAPREYVTRDGGQAFVCKKEGGNLFGVVIRKTNFPRACIWNVDGSFLGHDAESDLDLCDVPKRLTVHVNVYMEEGGYIYGNVYMSRDKAEEFNRKRIAYFEREITEGEGL